MKPVTEHTPRSQPDTVRVRPWGTVTLLEEGNHYRINRIELEPGQHISTQMHYHRSEHWIVVSGTAKVVCDGKETVVLQKQSTYVPVCMPHRVENPGVIPLGRMARAREVALPIAFLCSEGASYLCGATLDVNGGVFLN